MHSKRRSARPRQPGDARNLEAHIADAVRKGAGSVANGERWALGGTFRADDADRHDAKQETFGPVSPLYRLKLRAISIHASVANRADDDPDWSSRPANSAE